MHTITRAITLIIIIASLTSCSDNSEIKKAVASHLKDPDSARFGEISTVKMQEKDIEGKNIEIACVTVNAKNSFGGYGGDHQALVVKTIHGWETDGEPSKVSHKDCVERLTNRAQRPLGELEPFIVSLADTDATHYLQLSIGVTLDNESNRQSLNQLEPLIRNNVTLYLSMQKSDGLSTDDGKIRLRDGVRDEINSILKSRTDFQIKEVIIKSVTVM